MRIRAIASVCSKTFARIDPLARWFLAERGQATVEAAVVLPVLMLLFSILMQPVCALYSITVMRHVAAETARVAATTADMGTCRVFALRRLRAIPESSLFHVGGNEDWQVDVVRSADGRTCDVEVAGHMRPLPLFGVATNLMGESDAQGLRLCVRVSERVRPSWLGGEYGDWMAAWKRCSA